MHIAVRRRKLLQSRGGRARAAYSLGTAPAWADRDRHGLRLRALISVLWRAGLRVSEAHPVAAQDPVGALSPRDQRRRARIGAAGGRRFLDELDLPADAHERVTVALFMIATLEQQTHQIERQLRTLARHQPDCQALTTQFGVGKLIALTFLSELGDATRMSSSRKAVRFAGLDIGVHRSDHTSRVGHLTRHGSSPLRWAHMKRPSQQPAAKAPTTPTTTRCAPTAGPTPARR